MNRFEMMGQNPEEIKIEETFNPKKALSDERGILEKYKDRAKQVAKVLLLVSILSTSADFGIENKAYAQEDKPTIKTEQIQTQESKMLWSSSKERPAWIQSSPKTEKGYNLFVGQSEKYATEKGARDAAHRDALKKSGVAEHARVKEYYEEQRQDKSGQDYWVAFALLEVKIPSDSIKEKDTTIITDKKIEEVKKTHQEYLIQPNFLEINSNTKLNNQEIKSAVLREQIQKEKKQEPEKINKANLTESSKWSWGVVESSRADIKKIKTIEDAEQLVQTYFNGFVSEFYMPTRGDLKDGPYGIKTRDYTEDDSKFLLQNACEMKNIIQELNTKFGIKAYENRIEQANDIIKKLERQSSYSGQKQKEATK